MSTALGGRSLVFLEGEPAFSPFAIVAIGNKRISGTRAERMMKMKWECSKGGKPDRQSSVETADSGAEAENQ